MFYIPGYDSVRLEEKVSVYIYNKMTLYLQQLAL